MVSSCMRDTMWLALTVFTLVLSLGTAKPTTSEANSFHPLCRKGSNTTEYFPNPRNCSEFWICKNGVARVSHCPHGLSFNPVHHVCDRTFKTGCRLTAPIRHSDGPSCPTRNPRMAKLLPHETDCSLYYICESGVAIEKECPDDLHFNPKKLVCDYPERAGCDADYFAAEGKCPVKNPRVAKLIPHETDCHLFYICESGEAVPKECPFDLHFNPKKLVCDFPDRAGCTTEQESRTRRERKETTGVPSPYCPLINGAYPIFFPHPTDCSVYYMCGNGIAYEFTCPDGLHFNVRKKVCDIPHRAGCLRDKMTQGILLQDEPVCPAINPPVAKLIPHETECGSYYICESGEPILRECPEDLHFNPTRKVCDFPGTAGCTVEDEE